MKRTRLSASCPAQGYSCADGSQRSGAPMRYRPEESEPAGHAEAAELEEFFRQLEVVTGGRIDLEFLRAAHIDGVPHTVLAEQRRKHPGNVGRELDRAVPELKRALLAVTAAGAIREGRRAFVVSPRSGGLVTRPDRWTACISGSEARFGRAPDLVQLHDYVCSVQGVLFGTPDTYLGCWAEPQTHGWVLAVVNLLRDQDISVLPAGATDRRAIFHVPSGRFACLPATGRAA
jgi:hypothetical protein